MARKGSAISKAILALRMASREQGVTARQLAEVTGLKIRSAQDMLQALYELLKEDGLVGATMSRNKEPNTDSEGHHLPGAPVWRYSLRAQDLES